VPILRPSLRQTRGRDERLAGGDRGYPGRRVSAEDFGERGRPQVCDPTRRGWRGRRL